MSKPEETVLGALSIDLVGLDEALEKIQRLAVVAHEARMAFSAIGVAVCSEPPTTSIDPVDGSQLDSEILRVAKKWMREEKIGLSDTGGLASPASSLANSLRALSGSGDWK